MKNLFLFMLFLFSKVYSKGDFSYQEIHNNSHYPKIITLEDKNVLVFSSIFGSNKTLESKLNKKGELIYSYTHDKLNLSLSDKLILPKNSTNQNILLFHHDNLPYEVISIFSKGKIISSLKEPHSKYFKYKSLVSLKCGKILIAGIEKGNNTSDTKDIDVKIYDPKTNSYGIGISFGVDT